ncbi:hypothetical protein GCM10020331_034730 [Ectobacillus funiculus]
MRIDFSRIFTNVIAAGVSAFSIFTPMGRTPPVLANQLVSELLYVHVGMAVVSYATFTVSFIFFGDVFTAISAVKAEKNGMLVCGDLAI